MSAPVRYGRGPSTHLGPQVPRDLRKRRAEALRVRRRRLLAWDLAVGLLLALITIVASPGLAIVVLVALIALAGCGLSAMVGSVRRRREQQRARPRRAQASPPPRR